MPFINLDTFQGVSMTGLSPMRTVIILIEGAERSGKTALRDALASDDRTPSSITTGPECYDYLDIIHPGNLKLRAYRSRSIPRLDIGSMYIARKEGDVIPVILTIDLSQEIRSSDAVNQILGDNFRHIESYSRGPIIIVGTKADLAGSEAATKIDLVRQWVKEKADRSSLTVGFATVDGTRRDDVNRLTAGLAVVTKEAMGLQPLRRAQFTQEIDAQIRTLRAEIGFFFAANKGLKLQKIDGLTALKAALLDETKPIHEHVARVKAAHHGLVAGGWSHRTRDLLAKYETAPVPRAARSSLD